MGKLTQSLTVKLNEAMVSVNPKHEKTEEEKKDQESDKKLSNIEIELEEIANGVRDNLNSIFQRGEKFDSLA